MPEYVYALHDFSPENEDEVSFRAGERIEVIEKDDQFGDGWWRVSYPFTSERRRRRKRAAGPELATCESLQCPFSTLTSTLHTAY